MGTNTVAGKLYRRNAPVDTCSAHASWLPTDPSPFTGADLLPTPPYALEDPPVGPPRCIAHPVCGLQQTDSEEPPSYSRASPG